MGQETEKTKGRLKKEIFGNQQQEIKAAAIRPLPAADKQEKE